jgi:hypothetical protein
MTTRSRHRDDIDQAYKIQSQAAIAVRSLLIPRPFCVDHSYALSSGGSVVHGCRRWFGCHWTLFFTFLPVTSSANRCILWYTLKGLRLHIRRQTLAFKGFLVTGCGYLVIRRPEHTVTL